MKMYVDTIFNLLHKQYYAISVYIRQIVGTIVLFTIARYLPIYEFGLFSSYKNIATFCLLFTNLEYSNYILVSSDAKYRQVRIRIGLFLLNTLLLFLFIFFCSYFIRLENQILFILVLIRGFFDSTFFLLILPFFQATKTFNKIASINIIYSSLVLCIAIIAYILKLSLMKFLILNISLGIFNFLQCCQYAKINFGTSLQALRRKLTKYIDKSILNYISVALLGFLYCQTASLYVSLLLTKEEAALYFAAFTICSLGVLLYGAQTQKIMPSLMQEDYEIVKRIIRKNVLGIFLILLLVFILFVVFGHDILKFIYQKEYYLQAYNILLIIFLGNIFLGVGSVYGAYITASGNQKKKIPIQLSSLILLIICLVIFHPLRVYGASISYLITSIYASIVFIARGKSILNKVHGIITNS